MPQTPEPLSESKPSSPWSWQRLYFAIPWVLVLGLSIINVLLLKQNAQMRGVLGNKKPNMVNTGDKMPPFSAPGARGELFYVKYTGSGPNWVLLFFSPG